MPRRTWAEGRLRACGVGLLLAFLLAACGNDGASQAEMASGVAASAPAVGDGMRKDAGQAFLAYEHEVGVSLPGDGIEARLRETQAACADARFGDCVVLNVHQQGGDWPNASIGMRLAPAGVEPMIALASAGAELGSRSTRAEDLAVAVRDNELARDRLRRERERLEEFQARRDLAVADMIALSRQLAEVDAQLEAADQAGAQHRRRIDTQLLTIRFSATRGQEARNEVVQALRDSGSILATGTAWTIRTVAFLLPVLVVVGALVALFRRWRRRRRG